MNTKRKKGNRSTRVFCCRSRRRSASQKTENRSRPGDEMQAVTTRIDESHDEKHREKTSHEAKRDRLRRRTRVQDYEGRSARSGGGY